MNGNAIGAAELDFARPSCYSSSMRRWLAAVLAAVFISTATLHVFCHLGETSAPCGVCDVQQAGAVAAPVPAVVPSAVVVVVLPDAVAPQTSGAAVVRAAARAPPASRA
jgi:hypothetical protein